MCKVTLSVSFETTLEAIKDDLFEDLEKDIKNLVPDAKLCFNCTMCKVQPGVE